MRNDPRLWCALLTVMSCYRESPRPLGNAADPLVQRACPRTDDLRAPPVDTNPDARLRSHIDGVLSGESGRRWVGPVVPSHVPTRLGPLELFLADDADGGILAFYREPYDRSSCTLGGTSNCATEARFYDGAGRLAWTLPLAQVMSRPDHLEVQDIRLADGVLYFNEACQSYAAEAGRACSSLVAVDPRAPRVLWRTKPLTSNGRFRLRGCYIVAGYGFTAEPDFLHLVDRATGDVLQKLPVASAPEALTLKGRSALDVELYSGDVRRYRLDGFETAGASIVPLDAPAYGGAGYGGVGYGGAGYGGYGYGGAGYGRP